MFGEFSVTLWVSFMFLVHVMHMVAIYLPGRIVYTVMLCTFCGKLLMVEVKAT